ncbi:type IV pilus modification protein PilV [Massilia sp. GCM10023247]|uniref:type IV pilus modification protein PilV n=1 Tax=Massilia sp. GCM10023247 TaxID=3252643 RepID=UPI003619C9A4
MPCSRLAPCAGLSLIEVLVALFVLAVGVLGAAATQAASSRLRQQAALESDAVALAASLAARMRVNPAQMALPDAANPYLQLDYDGAAGAPADPPVHCFAGSSCDSAQLARFDIHELERAVYTGFPGGRIAVCRELDAGLALSGWDCAGGAAAPVVVKIGWRPWAGSGMPPRAALPVLVMVVAG